jgi:hypothetical protein
LKEVNVTLSNRPSIPFIEKQNQQNMSINFDMARCEKCGRNFFTSKIEKHMKYCDSLNKPREKFNANKFKIHQVSYSKTLLFYPLYRLYIVVTFY